MSDTDRELLALAAKAAGHSIAFDDISGLVWLENKYTGLPWNPLHSDADAFRLAVKLHIHIEPWSSCVGATPGCNYSIECEESYHRHNGDEAAAARRAIVRAAAEIGKRMK